MSLVLSVQSHVAYGYVGNRAAMVPLNALGHEVVALNTVSFSNHTGYGQWTGEVHEVSKIAGLIEGIKAQGLYGKIDAVLTGYIGRPELGSLIIDTYKDILKENPRCLYCCDPVMGDIGRGFFVDKAVPPFFEDEALRESSVVVPNQFEASHLTGVDIKTAQDAIKAINILHDKGADKVVITSYMPEDQGADKISMLVSQPDLGIYQVTTPLLDLSPMPNGAGDVTAATILGHILKGCDIVEAIELTATALYRVFEATRDDARRELSLIRMASSFNHTHKLFRAERLSA